MSTAKKLLLIAAGYALAIAGGFAAVAVNEFFMPEEISQTSGGMVAFGDMILFVLAAGFLGIVPTWFLLKLGIEAAPRALLAGGIVIALIGPVSWLAMVSLARDASPSNPLFGIGALGGFLIAFVAIPRMVAGPVLIAIEGGELPHSARPGDAHPARGGHADGRRSAQPVRVAYGARGPLAISNSSRRAAGAQSPAPESRRRLRKC